MNSSWKNLVWKSLAVSALIAVLMVFAGTAAFAAAAKPAPDIIGVIDSQKILFQHPKYEATAKQIQDMMRQKDGELKAAVDKEPDQAKKAQIAQAKRLEVYKAQEEMMAPIFKECEEAVRVVVKQRNVTVVLEKQFVHFGGQDITDYVIQQLARN